MPAMTVTIAFGCGAAFVGVPKDLHRLDDWLAPSAPFTLHCRQQLVEDLAAGETAEQAAHTARTRPLARSITCVDGRSGDSSACGAGLRSESKAALSADAHHLAWDLGALCRILRSRQEVMSRQALDELKQQISLLDYLQARIGGRPEHSTVVD